MNKYTCKTNRIHRYLEQLKKAEDKTFIITGANSGLGYSATKHFLSLGSSVIMACRNLDKANIARHNLLKLYPNANIIIMHYDQADFSSIDKFVKEINSIHHDFDGIILNAGIFHTKKGLLTKNGFPLIMGTNYLGIYYLLKKLKEEGIWNHQKERRIIFIGSLSWHRIKHSNIEEVLLTSKGNAIAKYARSKTLLGALTYLLSKHEANNVISIPKHVKVLMMHPGITSTNIVASNQSSYPKWFSRVAQRALSIFVHHADKASLGIIKLSLEQEIIEEKIVVPRGLFHISGYPTRKDYPKNLRIIDESLISITEKILFN